MEDRPLDLALFRDGVEIIRRDGRYFIRYDAGSHQETWREDEISEQEVRQIQSSKRNISRILDKLQDRLGFEAYRSNWDSRLNFLREQLEAMGVPSSYYSLGREQNERTCIVPIDRQWSVFYSEHGQMSDKRDFQDFESAREELLRRLA